MVCGCFGGGGGAEEDLEAEKAQQRANSNLHRKRTPKLQQAAEGAADGTTAEGAAQADPARSAEDGGGTPELRKVGSTKGEGGASGTPTHKRNSSSIKRNASKNKGSTSAEALNDMDSQGGAGVPRQNSRGNGGDGEGGTNMDKSRSLRKGGSEKDSTSPAASAATMADAGAGSARGMKITQSLKPPPTKNPQQQFSLSKKKPKDAAAEAKLAEEASKLDELLRSSDLRAFSYQDLKMATRGFSMDMLIGAGGFGKVYRGVVKLMPQVPEGGHPPVNSEPTSVEVAIKRLEAKSLQGHKEWMVEICMLGLVNHAHLVKLLGFCAEGEKRLLVYEFLPYYSLDRYLFGLDPSQPILDWNTRLRIALGSAKGLAHLHEEINPPIIYRDFKTSNILLDEEFNPKLSDFGLAREGPSMDRTHVSTQVRGTAGYAAPEYMLTGHLTPKADVWSFGVVLLEMLTGRPSIDQRKPQHEMKLVPLARQRLHQPGDILELMDPNLEGQFPAEAAAKVAEVAKWCLQSDPGNRPLMSELVEVLAYLSRPEWDM